MTYFSPIRLSSDMVTISIFLLADRTNLATNNGSHAQINLPWKYQTLDLI